MDAGTFWTAAGAIGTCAAAAVTVIAFWRTTKKSIRLSGRWKGELGDEWDFVAEMSLAYGHGAGNGLECDRRKPALTASALPWGASPPSCIRRGAPFRGSDCGAGRPS